MTFSALPGPAAYERHYVARLFEPWARWLLDRIGIAGGQRILDLATGPGTLARLAAARVGTNGYVLGADLSLGMLAIAGAKPSAGGPSVVYVAAAAAPLPFACKSFDLVTLPARAPVLS